MNERYRGYWIKHNPLSGYIWIEKDGAFIGSASSLADAHRLIDELVS